MELFITFIKRIQNIFSRYKYSDGFRESEKEVNSEVIKTRKGPKKKTENKMLPKINEGQGNDIIEKRDGLITCVLSGHSKQYLGKEYTEQQFNEMDINYINILSNRYESCLSAQMTKSLGKSVIYSSTACSASGVGNQQDLSNDLECDPFLNTALRRFTCDLYYRFGAFLAPISIGIITGKHYTKNHSPKLMADQRTETVNQQKQETITKQKNQLRRKEIS